MLAPSGGKYLQHNITTGRSVINASAIGWQIFGGRVIRHETTHANGVINDSGSWRQYILLHDATPCGCVLMLAPSGGRDTRHNITPGFNGTNTRTIWQQRF